MVNSNSNTVTNASTLERRLKPIYDCLDNGSNKKAVQEADKLLKKVKGLQCVKALKSLALLRLSKDDAANEILSEISLTEQLDEITLQTMTICYRESSQVDKIVDLYEAARQRDPANEELMAHLFMAYVRTCHYQKQEEIARNMYTTYRKRPYIFWAIMSLVMQARIYKNQDKLARVCLSLAEKRCKKIMDEEKTHEELEVELYIMILHKLGMYDEEYRVLTGPMCLRNNDHLSKLTRAKAYLCLDLKMYTRAFKHYFPNLIQDYPDQLEYYEGLFKSALLLETEAASQQPQQQSQGDQQTASIPPKAGSSFAECFDIVERQCLIALESNHQTQKPAKNLPSSVKNQQVLSRSSSKQNRNMIRGPFMARIAFNHMIQTYEASLPANSVPLCKSQCMSKYPSLSMLLMDFFQSFSVKLSCFYDMEYMVSKCQLKKEDISQLLADLKTWVDSECEKLSTSDECTFTAFSILLNYHMLDHCFKDYQPADDLAKRTSLAKNYIHLYDTNLQLGKNNPKTDFLPVDHYCILAANSLLTNTISSSDTSLLTNSLIISTLVMLENAMINSPSNHLIKLTLLKLYGFVGASKISASILEMLDIKHFQIDTLGHLLNPVLYYCGHYSSSQESLQTCSKFYIVGLRECYDSLTTSYRNCRFAQIEQLTDVKDRLANSLNNKQCSILSIVVKILNIGSHPETVFLTNIWQSSYDMKQLHDFDQNNSWDEVRDNRDFKVLRSLHSQTTKLISERLERSYKDELLWLQVRYHIIKCVSLCYSSNISSLNENSDIHKNLLDSSKILVELKSKLASIHPPDGGEKCPEMQSYLEPEATPFRSNCVNMDQHLTLIIYLIDYYINVVSGTETTADMKKCFNSYLEKIYADLENSIKQATCLANMRQVLSAMTITIETISIGIMIVISLTPKMQQQIGTQLEKVNSSPLSITTNQKIKGGSSNTNKSSSQSSSAQKQTTDTNKSNMQLSVNDLINRFEGQVSKMLSLLKTIDYKAIVNDEGTKLLPELISGQQPLSQSDLGGLRQLLNCEVGQHRGNFLYLFSVVIFLRLNHDNNRNTYFFFFLSLIIVNV